VAVTNTSQMVKKRHAAVVKIGQWVFILPWRGQILGFYTDLDSSQLQPKYQIRTSICGKLSRQKNQ